MADEKHRADAEPENIGDGQGLPMENFGPLTSLEPDGPETLGAGGAFEGSPAPGGGGAPDRPGPAAREGVPDCKGDLRYGMPEEHGKRARQEEDAKQNAGSGSAREGSRGEAGKGSGRRRKAETRAGARGAGAGERPASARTVPGEPDHGGKGADWTVARADGVSEESEADAFLLDDSFLRRTFKEVNFPAAKEMCLRYVDMEQDFVYGKDRTVNLHNLITHLDEETFPSRRSLIQAIKEHLARRHHHHGP